MYSVLHEALMYNSPPVVFYQANVFVNRTAAALHALPCINVFDPAYNFVPQR